MAAQMCISCKCGAHYEREDVQLPIKDVGIYECLECGAVLEHWAGRIVPKFKLIPRDAKRSDAA